MTMKTKEFDCVEMMHRGALRIHAELQGTTREEQLAYWRRQNEEARDREKRVRDAHTDLLPKNWSM